MVERLHQSPAVGQQLTRRAPKWPETAGSLLADAQGSLAWPGRCLGRPAELALVAHPLGLLVSRGHLLAVFEQIDRVLDVAKRFPLRRALRPLRKLLMDGLQQLELLFRAQIAVGAAQVAFHVLEVSLAFARIAAAHRDERLVV